MWQLAFLAYVVLFLVSVLGATVAISGLHSLITGEQHLLSRIDIEQVTE